MAPDSVRMREALIQQYMRDGARDKALQCAQSGAALTNASPRAQALMAATYERLGKPELAVDIYRRLAASFPQNGDWSQRSRNWRPKPAVRDPPKRCCAR